MAIYSTLLVVTPFMGYRFNEQLATDKSALGTSLVRRPPDLQSRRSSPTPYSIPTYSSLASHF